MLHFSREDKESPFSLEAELTLEVAKEVSEVNVEEVSCLGHHDVAVVSVSHSHYESSHTVTST